MTPQPEVPTPRTDREAYKTTKNDIGFDVVNPALCRQLEQELSAITAENVGLRAERDEAIDRHGRLQAGYQQLAIRQQADASGRVKAEAEAAKWWIHAINMREIVCEHHKDIPFSDKELVWLDNLNAALAADAKEPK